MHCSLSIYCKFGGCKNNTGMTSERLRLYRFLKECCLGLIKFSVMSGSRGASTYCKFRGCLNNSCNKNIHFYRFPKDENRCQVWIKACENKTLEGISASKHYDSSRICSDHFQDWCFVNSTTKHRLVHNAIPNSPKPPPIQVRDTTYISCSIPGCLSKSHREIKHSSAVGEKHILMFPVPHTNDELFNKWKEAVKEAEIELTGGDHICELHFQETNIKKHHKIKAPDGEIIEVPMKFPTLEPDAVPQLSCIVTKDACEKTHEHHHFPVNDIEGLHRTEMPDEDNEIMGIPEKLPTLKPDVVSTKPSCLATEDSSEKTLLSSENSILKVLLLKSGQSLSYNSNATQNSNDSEDSIVCSGSENICDLAVDSLTNHDDSPDNSVQGQTSHTRKCLLYSELVENIQLVKKPSEFWSVVCTYQFTIFARWNTKLIPEKRLVIENPFSVRVFLKDWEIEMTDLVNITSIDDVSLLLEKVEDYKLDLTC